LPPTLCYGVILLFSPTPLRFCRSPFPPPPRFTGRMSARSRFSKSAKPALLIILNMNKPGHYLSLTQGFFFFFRFLKGLIPCPILTFFHVGFSRSDHSKRPPCPKPRCGTIWRRALNCFCRTDSWAVVTRRQGKAEVLFSPSSSPPPPHHPASLPVQKALGFLSSGLFFPLFDSPLIRG